MNKKVKLKTPDTNDLALIHGISHDGRGIATINNKTAFIAGGLPNETLTYKMTHKRSNYIEANALEIISASTERVNPPCEYFGICGGCSLQHMSTETQLQFKQQTLLDQLKHFGKVTPLSVLPPLNVTTLGYRRKARLGVKFVIKKDKLLVGFREKSSSYLADLERCLVLHPAVGARFMELRELIISLDSYREIPQIEVAIGDTQVGLVFRHLKTLSHSDIQKLKDFGKTYQFHLYLQPNSPAPTHKIWPEDPTERLTYCLPDEKLEFLFHPLDFTQINLEVNRLMVAQAMDLLDLQPQETALDLFCGIGNFTLPIAKRAYHVTGIEGSDDMVSRATENAHHNHINNVDYYAANLEKPSSQAEWTKKRYNKILLDPPRVGAAEILPLIPQFAAKRIVYVSCNPATLARDAGELVHTYKYQLKKVGIMNMFPHTSHIEAMAVFDKEE
jgi:23S rRNA (uracil1939-C5)-methyltransferase